MVIHIQFSYGAIKRELRYGTVSAKTNTLTVKNRFFVKSKEHTKTKLTVLKKSKKL